MAAESDEAVERTGGGEDQERLLLLYGPLSGGLEIREPPHLRQFSEHPGNPSLQFGVRLNGKRDFQLWNDRAAPEDEFLDGRGPNLSVILTKLTHEFLYSVARGPQKQEQQQRGHTCLDVRVAG